VGCGQGRGLYSLPGDFFFNFQVKNALLLRKLLVARKREQRAETEYVKCTGVENLAGDFNSHPVGTKVPE